MKGSGSKGVGVILAMLLGVGWPWGATAEPVQPANAAMLGEATPVSTTPGGDSQDVAVPLNKSRILEFPNPVKILSIGNPEVADIMVVRARQVYILGKSLGTTNVILWDKNEQVQGTIDVEVTHDLQTLKANLHSLLPDERVQVRSNNGTLVLGGEITSAQRMDAALRLAESFTGPPKKGEGPPVLNLMQLGGAQQVMLDVKVAEVSRSLVKRLDIQFDFINLAHSEFKVGGVNGGAVFPDALFEPGDVRIPALSNLQTPIGPMIDEFAPLTHTIEDVGIFGSYLDDDWLLNLILDAGNREGVAKILAEPNLTTLTGEEARFLAGGEFPIPVPQGDNQVTIEYKEFGVSLSFVPVVLDSGVINLRVYVAVSDLVTDIGVITGLGSQASRQLFVPALAKRSASSTVELGSGQTIAIAGMLSENLRENVEKFPGLGDIPILGQLFRSQEFIKDQTELVIFVTPRLARPITPDQIRLPTGSFVAPSDLEFYLLGRLHSKKEADGDRERKQEDENENGTGTGTGTGTEENPVEHQQIQATLSPETASSPQIQTIDPLLNRQDGGTEGRFGHDF